MIRYKIETKKLTAIFETRAETLAVFHTILHFIHVHKYIKLIEINGRIETIKMHLKDDNTHVDN
mgnify:CR=1 FL=1